MHTVRLLLLKYTPGVRLYHVTSLRPHSRFNLLLVNSDFSLVAQSGAGEEIIIEASCLGAPEERLGISYKYSSLM